MRTTSTEVIDGYAITVTQLAALRSIKLLHRLGKALGPAMLKAGGAAKSLSDLDLGNLADAATMAFDKFSEADLEQLIKELFETATIRVGPNEMPFLSVYDNELAGKADTLLKAVRFAVAANFPTLWQGLAGSLARLQAPAAVQSKA